jgi:hypothetical protein
MEDFYRRITLKQIDTVIALSEAIYPVRVDWGIAIFSQAKNAAPEAQGEMEKPFLGLNYRRCADVYFPVPIPICYPEHTLQGRAYCPAEKPYDAVNEWKGYIKDCRNKHGFHLTTRDIEAVRSRIASYNESATKPNHKSDC